ncbi:MAG: MOP flippase family protein [Anaerolineales bacterium]|nr:MOP flippase family protein [Anaerolineales bacterium]
MANIAGAVKTEEGNGGFRQKTLFGLTWSIINQVGWQGLTFIISIVLARLLSPREFGLITMVTILTNFAGVFTDLGFSAALIQKQDVQSQHLSSIFWLNAVSGFLLMLLFIFGSPWVGNFYGEPILASLTILVSASLFISSLGSIHRTLLTKSLDFRRLSVVDLVSVGLSGAVAIGLAFAGFGVWSLAVQSVVSASMVTILLWSLSSWRPGFDFSWQAIKNLLGFSTKFLGTSLLNYGTSNIDNLLVGHSLGTIALGIYIRAYSLMLFPLLNISRVISRVIFPSFSLISEDKVRVKRLYLKMTRTIALITFPLMLGLFVLVEPFVLTVFGPRWAEVAPILRILCLVSLSQSIVTFNGSLYLSQGRADLQFKMVLLLRANQILGIVIGLWWGVMGVAVGFTIASFINFYPNVSYAGRLIGLTFVEFLRNLAPIFSCAVVMAVAVWGLGLFLPVNWPHWAFLITQTAFGGAVYGTLVHYFNLQGYREVKELLAGFLASSESKMLVRGKTI